MKVAQTLPVAALLASSAAATGWFPACAVCVTSSLWPSRKLTSMASGTTALQATMEPHAPPAVAGNVYARTQALSTH
jgi:hypothetical protein